MTKKFTSKKRAFVVFYKKVFQTNPECWICVRRPANKRQYTSLERLRGQLFGKITKSQIAFTREQLAGQGVFKGQKVEEDHTAHLVQQLAEL